MSVPYGAHRYLACHGIIGRSSGDLSTIYRGAYAAGHVGFFCLVDEPRSIRFVEGHSLPASIPRPDNIVRTSRGTTGNALLLLDLVVPRLLFPSPSRSSRACILCHPIKVHYLSSYRVSWPWSWHASADTIGPLDHPIAAQCAVARQPNWPARKKRYEILSWRARCVWERQRGERGGGKKREDDAVRVTNICSRILIRSSRDPAFRPSRDGWLIKCSCKYSHTYIRILLRRRISEGLIYAMVKEGDYFRVRDCRIMAVIYCTIQC